MNDRFIQAIERVRKNGKTVNGIGTYSESTLHAVLKNYYEPDPSRHELRLGKYVADIIGQEGIIEIQTHQLFRLKEKISNFLSVSRVSVVFPVIKDKYVVWSDAEAGKMSGKRKSTKHETVYTAVSELYPLREFILNPGFRFIVPIITAVDYKSFKRNKYGRKTDVHRLNCIPIDLIDEKFFICSDDYEYLIPADLPEIFTSADFAREARISKSSASNVLRLLYDAGVVVRTGKVGNAWKYSKKRISNQHRIIP